MVFSRKTIDTWFLCSWMDLRWKVFNQTFVEDERVQQKVVVTAHFLIAWNTMSFAEMLEVLDTQGAQGVLCRERWTIFWLHIMHLSQSYRPNDEIPKVVRRLRKRYLSSANWFAAHIPTCVILSGGSSLVIIPFITGLRPHLLMSTPDS